jgi:branched-subunit amino acid ABC-type transport system permease component
MAQLLLNGLVLGSLYAMIGYGFGLVYWINRTFHFGHSIVLAVTGYALFVLSGFLHWWPMAAVAGSAFIAMLVGAAVELLLYRPLRRRQASRMMYFLVAFGGLAVVSGLLQLIFGEQTRFVRIEIATFQLAGLTLASNQMVVVAAAPLVLAGIVLFFRTRTGTAVRALADNPVRAEMVGVPRDLYYLLSVMLGSGIAALPVFLLVTNRGTSPSSSVLFTFYGVMSTFVGGVGSMPGIYLGGLLLGIAESLGVWQLPTEWQTAIAFGVLLVFILVRPTGIFGREMVQRRV